MGAGGGGAVESLTKPTLSGALIGELVRGAFGAGARVVEVDPADDGWYNAGFRLRLEGPGAPGRAFLKVSPPAGTKVLSYEQGLMGSEAATLRALAGAGVGPVPAILAEDFSRRILPSDALFMEGIEGVMLSEARPLMSAADRARVRRQIGEVCGAAGRIEGETFGYAGRPGLQGPTWPAAFEAMALGLIADARAFGAALPAPAEVLETAFRTAAAGLDPDVRPCLTHYDLWDKNVLVRREGETWTLSGIVDWERGFFGDPLADVFSATASCDAGERAAVLEGIAAGRGAAHLMDEADERRLAIYRAYLWLVAITEAPSRGFGGSIRTPQSSAGRRLLRDLARAGCLEGPAGG